jgi:septal ring factor EnvC (AmiA/AmiB activator)
VGPARALALLLVLAGPAPAQEGTAEAAARASARMGEARALLERARGATDRMAALTETVQAYEEGLALLRESLRRTATARAALEAELAADREGIARLLGVLQSMGEAPEPVLLLHPSGPLGTARAGMILADVAPALQAEAEALRGRLATLEELGALQAEAERTLREGLLSAQDARAGLAAAAADREGLPRAYTEDPVATALLLASTESLDAFAAGLGETVDAVVAEAAPPAAEPRGDLALPVEGTVLRRPGEADASGTVRPGVVLATAPRALVRVPVAATLRFRGPLLDYGTVAILEPRPGTLFLLAGLAQVFGEAGEVLPAGSALGLMGGEAPGVETAGVEVPGVPGAHAILSAPAPAQGDPGGADLTETLYLEVRDGDGPIDPSAWFALP